ncbi:uncharacterized protein ASPGLDRAFT_26761 [Aspergillus glaucus CBS 516.65]|uniref:Telomeric single stranded DNA binding POT1/Cdc13 domain-containing protein n=1 Tax=Aspergillus glaucus CBS 516.65 TaxID=1160497 RepID=A0A1L9VGU3_ASPGL|nr:hypothetical protein ASPGLDRAFT_26761 [Aspergillus glaucus CBS 516.65]OJJ83168.1 hypothetical protein ASPGLDRAFT_26761 [Aspergillus glaucus CBS 516.65]
MDTNNDQPPSSDPGHPTTIPIAQINPDLDRLSESSIRATVTLVWPYSSSTKAFSFLLADPDFRLRRSNGQVKVVLHGLVAEKVAETRVGIGDEVVLSLAGSRLDKNETATQTPGRYVAWDVHFDNRVHLEISRSSNHYATVKVDTPVEPAQRIEEEPAPPVTPVPSRTRPGEHIATGGLGSWTSPAFFQRSRASFGVNSRLDPFAEEDGFVPGKGRKRPRFSMRSSEWRFIDEPADPDEKGSPVDWTEELEDEIESEPEPGQLEPESKVDKENTAEVVGAPQETLITTGSSPGAEAIPVTTTEDTAITVDRPTSEPSADVEQPAEQDAAKAAEVAREAHEKGFHVNGLHIPMDTPRLLPIPSPGLPVPSPLVSADNRQGYFSSAAATIAQLSAPQQSTTATQYESTRVEENVETRTQITQTETIGAPVPQTTHEGAAVSLHETAPEDPIASATPEPGDLITEDDVQSDERHETAATDVHQNEPSPSPNMEAPVEEEPHIEHIAIQPPEDVEMEDAEYPLINKQHESEDDEEDDEDSQEEASDEESGVEEIEGESENVSEEDDEEEKEDDEEEGARANQAIDMRSHELHNGQYATDSTESPNKTAQSQAEAYSESKDQRHHIEEDEEVDVEDEDENEEDEEMDDEEASEGDYESGYVYENDDEDDVDSESESDDEQYQVQPPQNNTQPEIIVLDSDDEDEQPDASSQARTRAPPIQGQPASDQEQSDDESHAEEEDWTSDEEGEDEVMAEREYDDEKDHHVEDEDDYVEDEEVAAEEETVKDGGQDHYVEDDDEDDYSMDEEEPAGVGSARGDEQGHYVEEEEESAEEEAMRDEERADQVKMVERTRRTENEQVAEPTSDDQEQGSLAEDEQKQDEREHGKQDVEATTSAEYEIVTCPDVDESAAGKHHEEAQVTEDLRQYSEQDLHENPCTHTPRETTPGAASYQSETIRDDVGSSGRQEVEEGEVRFEEPSRTVELDQDKDSGLWYDGARSPRVGHDTTTITTETFEPSGLSVHDRQTDDTVETEYSHQGFENYSINEKAITSQDRAPSHEQAEILAEDDEAMVEAPDVPEANNVLPTTEQEPRSRSASVSEHEWAEANEYTVDDVRAQEEQEPRSPSASISQHEWAEANEYAADEAQEAANEETSLQLQLQDETRVRESIEESDSYTQHPAGPDRRYPGLRSKHSYYAPLSTLVDHFDALIDAVSVVSETSPIIHSASGNKDYSLTLYLTDPSMVGTTLTAQIFRPHLEALPSVSEGDIILLRNFKVKSFNHYMMLVSSDTSAWAVFSPSQDEAQMTGPPVEYDDEERTHVSYLRDWYQSDGAAMIVDNQLQASIVEASREMTPMSSVAASDTASLDDFPGREGRRDSTRRDRRGRKSHRRITIHELRDGRRYTEIGSPSDPESIHELRDGTVYAHL